MVTFEPEMVSGGEIDQMTPADAFIQTGILFPLITLGGVGVLWAITTLAAEIVAEISFRRWCKRNKF